jgi:hypothetical protein
VEQPAISRGIAAGVSDRYFSLNGKAGGYFTQLRTDAEMVHRTGRMFEIVLRLAIGKLALFWLPIACSDS